MEECCKRITKCSNLYVPEQPPGQRRQAKELMVWPAFNIRNVPSRPVLSCPVPSRPVLSRPVTSRHAPSLPVTSITG
eukprot:10205727-Ditylum_brightwellii.AAC.1